MESNYKYKSWNKLLLLGSPVLLIVLIFAVFSRTWDMYQENIDIRSKIERGESAPKLIGQMNQRLKVVQARFNAYAMDSIKNREYLLQVVSDFCKKNNLVLKEFPQIALEEHQNIGISTNTIVAEGNYINLLKLLYKLEYKVGVGRPASVDFEKYYDFKRKKEILQLTIYLQTIVARNEN